MDKDEFNTRLVKAGISIKEFARLSGKHVKTIKKYTVKGVPKNQTTVIDDLLTQLGKQMHIEEYIEQHKG